MRVERFDRAGIRCTGPGLARSAWPDGTPVVGMAATIPEGDGSQMLAALTTAAADPGLPAAERAALAAAGRQVAAHLALRRSGRWCPCQLSAWADFEAAAADLIGDFRFRVSMAAQKLARDERRSPLSGQTVYLLRRRTGHGTWHDLGPWRRYGPGRASLEELMTARTTMFDPGLALCVTVRADMWRGRLRLSEKQCTGLVETEAVAVRDPSRAALIAHIALNGAAVPCPNHGPHPELAAAVQSWPDDLVAVARRYLENPNAECPTDFGQIWSRQHPGPGAALIAARLAPGWAGTFEDLLAASDAVCAR